MHEDAFVQAVVDYLVALRTKKGLKNDLLEKVCYEFEKTSREMLTGQITKKFAFYIKELMTQHLVQSSQYEDTPEEMIRLEDAYARIERMVLDFFQSS